MIRSQLRAARAIDRMAPPPKQRKEATSRPSTEYRGGRWGYDLTERLRLLKGDLGARAWADFLGLSNSLVSSYLSGGRQPSAPSLRIIAEKTGVSLDWLLFGEGGPGPVLRGQWRTEATLQEDLAAHVERESGLTVGADRGEWQSSAAPSIAADAVLSSAVATAKEEARRWRVWGIRLRAHLDAVADRVAMARVAGPDDSLGVSTDCWVRSLAQGESVEAHKRFFLPDGADAPPYTTVYRKGGVFLMNGSVIESSYLHQEVAQEALLEFIEEVAEKRALTLEQQRAMRHRDRYNAIRARAGLAREPEHVAEGDPDLLPSAR